MNTTTPKLTRLLTRADVAGTATMPLAIDAVQAAFLAHGTGETRMPVKVYLPLPEHAGDFRAMPSFAAGGAGVKWVNAHPENPARFGLPSVMGVYILSDPATAFPLAILDATLLTALRTGAAAAVATRALLPRAPKSVAFIGCGVQARMFLAAHEALFGKLEWRMADVRTSAAETFAAEAGGRAVSIGEAAAADVVCIATPSRTPVVLDDMVRAGTHINAMGADAPGKQELDPRILLRARVFVDDLEQASESGEVNVSLHDGTLTREKLAGTLGDVVAGKARARLRDDDVTVFDSTGLAVQDLLLAQAVLRVAQEQNVGTEIDLVGVAARS
jgi:ornithine cyclodeaminase/alanine dehydrogenase